MRNILLPICLLFCLFLFALQGNAQQPILVANTTVKVPANGEQNLYYGFAEGDKLLFQFDETHGRELKMLSIAEVAASSPLFQAQQSGFEEVKTIVIPKKGIYKFRLVNGSLLGARHCNLHIYRIPVSKELANFNTQVFTRLVADTVFDYKEVPYQRRDTIITELVNQVAKVHSVLNKNGNKNILNFKLPEGTIKWSYYIGVDQEGQQAYQKATERMAKSGGALLNKLPGYGPLAALALGAASYLTQVQNGEDVDYVLLDDSTMIPKFIKGQPYKYLRKGKVINDFSRMEPMKGNIHLCLINDNAITGISVFIKIIAVTTQNTTAMHQQPIIKKITERAEMYLKN